MSNVASLKPIRRCWSVMLLGDLIRFDLRSHGEELGPCHIYVLQDCCPISLLKIWMVTTQLSCCKTKWNTAQVRATIGRRQACVLSILTAISYISIQKEGNLPTTIFRRDVMLQGKKGGIKQLELCKSLSGSLHRRCRVDRLGS